ncbi:MAG TPA: hypothetical protein VHD76_13505 [Bryobacteraceae bacterium]|jgi:UDP-N-acetyl-D-mannosaminuronate dehydrogenase|nr:hypothetical protein [Bryobacteraceae bacterium]
MSENSKVVVAGLGEIGKPLSELLAERYDVIGVDVSPAERIEQAAVLHVCYPFQIGDFIGETARYIALFKPSLTVINSTVAIGVTRAIAERTGATVVNSPVRGKHARMASELRSYTKFIGALDRTAGDQAAKHFESVGLKTKILASPEATELAKLTETTYFGLIIAWAQEVERYCNQSGQDYNEVVSFYEEIAFLPPKYFPGIIGGHCVMPNIQLLSQYGRTPILEAIQASNKMKIEQTLRSQDVAAVA